MTWRCDGIPQDSKSYSSLPHPSDPCDNPDFLTECAHCGLPRTALTPSPKPPPSDSPAPNTTVTPTTPDSPTNIPPKPVDWQKATIIGSVVGISVLSGFVLARSLTPLPDSPTPEPSSPATTPQPTPPIVVNPTTYPTAPIPEPASPVMPPSVTITSQEAKELVAKWLSSKQVIMAPPYDRKILAEITTGKQYRDAITAMNWLEANNAYWKYSSQNISNVYQFNVDGDRATIQVKVIENLVYYKNGKRYNDRSGIKTTIVTYSLQYIDSSWKIADSENQ